VFEHRHRDARSRIMYLCRVSAQSMAGMRSRDWYVETVFQADLLNSQDMPRRIATMNVLLYRAMDYRNPDQVRRFPDLLANHIQHYPDGFRQSSVIELAL
jgi:hypothetical protein